MIRTINMPLVMIMTFTKSVTVVSLVVLMRLVTVPMVHVVPHASTAIGVQH